MKYPFDKSHSRILTVVTVLALVMTMLTGCFGGGSQKETEPQSPPKLNLNETNEPTETVPPETTEPINENIAIVLTTTNVRSSPGTTSPVVSTLDPGTEVEILDRYGVFGVEWALIKEGGWVVMENLEMKYASEDPTDATTPDESTPDGTDPDATEPEQPGSNQNTGNGKLGVITASELNIRKKADQSSDKVGMYNYGDRVTILESNNGWGRTDKGWISLSYVYMDGTTGKNTGKGIVTGTQLYIRSGPGTNYDTAGSLNKGDRVNILEQIKVGDMTWGCIDGGWISLSYVYMDGTTGEGSGTGTVTGDDLNIRSGPGTKYNSVGSLDKGDTVKVYAQITIGDMTWGCIDGGWVSMSFVSMN